MSWNKNTINNSQLYTFAYTFGKVRRPINIEIIGYAEGYGLNDIYEDNIGLYPIRKLSFDDIVVLEQMQRTVDCDTDDTIVSIMFDADKVPSDWPIEITIE